MRRLLLLIVVLFPVPAWATEYYVDNSCPYPGTGLVRDCAAAAGQAGAINDLQAFLNRTTLQPGDTIYIRAGSRTYVTTNGSSNWLTIGFHIDGSGTATNPITIRNFPGEYPTLANCADGATTVAECFRPTLTGHGSYLRITGFKVRGQIALDGSASMAIGNTIDHMEITGGFMDDGNWSAIFLQGQTGAWVHHNYLHDVVALAGYSSGATSCIKLFTAINGTYEWNTCENANTSGGSAAFDDKQDSVRNTFRYNLLRNVFQAVRLQAQPAAYAAMTGTRVYQNVMIARSGSAGLCLKIDDGPRTDFAFFNNTCFGFIGGVEISVSSNVVGTEASRVYNNIFASLSSNNVSYYGQDVSLEDYNAYTSGRSYRVNPGTYSTLAMLRAAKPSYDAGSRELGSFGFASTTDLTLTAGSAAKNAGRTGGTPDGTFIDLGAYIAPLTCVGHRCSSETPSAPSNVRIKH
jgi:hypothetical protein